MQSKKEYAKAYYKAHREEILKRAKMLYKRKGNGKCNGCGADITKLQEANHGNLKYCNKCIADKGIVSRQEIWYRKNRFRLRYIRKIQRQKIK